MQTQLRNLSLADFEVIAILCRYQSLRALARNLKQTISNVSKKISKIEVDLG